MKKFAGAFFSGFKGGKEAKVLNNAEASYSRQAGTE